MKNRIPPAALGVSGWFLAGARQIACLKMGHKCWGLFDDKCDMGNLMIVDGDLNITTSDSGGKWMQGALRFQVLESPTWGCIQLGKWVNKTPLTYYIWYMIVYDCIWIYIYIYIYGISPRLYGILWALEGPKATLTQVWCVNLTRALVSMRSSTSELSRAKRQSDGRGWWFWKRLPTGCAEQKWMNFWWKLWSPATSRMDEALPWHVLRRCHPKK